MSIPILARLASIAAPLPSGLPTEIQWMPPGEHEIRATQAGKPVTRRVRVTATTAHRLQAQLQGIRAKAAAGTEDMPFLDFNHEDREAAGFVTAFHWGGDDPVSGGVRATVEWTGPGRAALEGRAFRRFSPSFHVDADGEVISAPLNMGGLVNKAAFKTITPIVAGAAGDSHPPMDPTEKLAADLASAQKTITELQAKLATATNLQEIKAKDAEISTLKETITSLNARLADQAKSNAKAIVDAAVKAGKIPAQNTALQAKWVDAITANPDIAETLNAMQGNPALGTAITGATGGGGGNGGEDATVQAKARDQAVAEYQAKHGCDHSAAWNAVRSSKPELFGLTR